MYSQGGRPVGLLVGRTGARDGGAYGDGGVNALVDVLLKGVIGPTQLLRNSIRR